MKRMSVILLACLLLMTIIGCNQQNKQTAPPVPAPPEISPAPLPSTPESLSEPEPLPPQTSLPQDDHLTVMDAPLYRGVVTAISEEKGVYELRLEQVEGADFGYPSFMMHTSEATRSSFSFAELVPGNYLEVYYGERNDGLPPVIIAANKLPPAVDCVFNGELTALEHQGSQGRLEMTALSNGEEIHFNFDDSTQFYMDMESLKSGDKLNIYHRGTLTKSIPPQGFALEVRPYTAP